MLVELLTENGYLVTEAENGLKGIEMLAGTIPDLIITDIIMPDRDGLEVIIEMKKKNPALKIIAVSGGGTNTAETYLKMAKALGASATLEKPFHIDELLKEIRQLTEQ